VVQAGTSADYIEFLRQRGKPLFRGADTDWTLYRNVVVPALPTPTFPRVSESEARRILRNSGAAVMRWTDSPSRQPTSWWWAVCNDYDLGSLSSKMRNQIKKGHRLCSVRRLKPEWLAEHGYETYCSAFKRYRSGRPATREAFMDDVLSSVGFESIHHFWGAFHGSRLVGYVKLAVTCEGVGISVMKYHTDFIQLYPAYALIDHILREYVSQQGLPVSNGQRPVSHDTNVQQFLEKFGFRKSYCRLRIHYVPLVSLALAAAYPLRHLGRALPVPSSLRTLLFQEELRRCWQVPQLPA